MTQNTTNFQNRTSSAIKFLRAEKGITLKNDPYSVRIALVYPNSYYVGMSNLGFQSVYALINQIEGIRCERAFLPERTRYDSNQVITIETQTPIEKFDIIAFSISFENDVLSVLRILQNAGLPLLSEERNENYPLILAGGVLCFLNPEPLSLFIDCFLIGEAEVDLKEFFNNFNPRKNKKNNLIHMAQKIPSLYVPSLFKTKYTSKGTIDSMSSIDGRPNIINRAITKNITANPINTAILTPNTAFRNSFLIEVSRGCPHGCRFCGAGYIYKPPRFQSKEVLKTQILDGLALTNKIGFVGSAISDYPDIDAIYDLMGQDEINFTFSSLRADKITEKTIKILKKSNTKTATIAPDAGSERLRKVINKKITEKHILNATEKLVLGGIPNLKLYFIVGLPTETDDDIKAIITLCKKIKDRFLENSRVKKRIGQINISLNPFVPKPFTPFQWAPMEKISILKKKINFIKHELKQIANINVQSESIRLAYIQALIARGDRNIGNLLMSVHKNNFNWPKTLKASKIDTNFYVYRQRDSTEIFPWDFIKQGVSKQFLFNEYKLAINNCIFSPFPDKK